jgi:hypothetical protein
MHCGFGRYYRTQKERALKEMNALLILKTTKSSNVRQNCHLPIPNLKRTKEKRAAELINANNELIFQSEEKVNAQQN